jgi:uncharacterized C2H2 Zn-finger protein
VVLARYRCPFCKLEFDGLKEYWKHLHTVHKEKMGWGILKGLKCPVCGEKFKNLGGFEFHIKMKHPDVLSKIPRNQYRWKRGKRFTDCLKKIGKGA